MSRRNEKAHASLFNLEQQDALCLQDIMEGSYTGKNLQKLIEKRLQIIQKGQQVYEFTEEARRGRKGLPPRDQNLTELIDSDEILKIRKKII